MRIQSYNTLQYQNKNCKPSFQRIEPEFLFVKTRGFEQNLDWANSVVKIINDTTSQIANNVPFKSVISNIAKAYSRVIPSKSSYFGLRRAMNTIATGVGEFSKYSPYWERLIEKAEKFGKKTEPSFTEIVDKYKLSDGKTEIGLNKIEMYQDKIGIPRLINLESPDASVADTIFDEVAKKYAKFVEDKSPVTKDNMQETTKKIAEMYWLLSQARPYYRGTAGIADAFSKSMFEAKGIQLSSFKENVNPNIEAFLLPIEEFSEKYESFFEKPFTLIADKG